MKKFLNISVIAALAVLPLAANAAVTDADPGATNASAPVAENAPKYSLAAAGTNDDTHVATAGYVKGAYNAAIKAINKVATTADSAVKSVTAGTANGTISVDGGADVTIYNDSVLAGRVTNAEGDIDALETTVGDANSGLVKDVADLQTAVGDANSGLTKAVADNASDIDALETAVGDANSGLTKAVADNASDIADLETAVGDANSGLVKDVADLQTTVGDANSGLVKDVADLQANSLTASALTDYAKKTGVTQTITNSTISGTVPVLTAWNNDNSTDTIDIEASITGATYAEPAAPQQGG